MAVSEAESVPVRQLAPWPATNGESELRGVSAVSSDEIWAVGSTVCPDTGRTRALVGRWTPDLQVLRAAPADPDADVLLAGVAGAGDTVWAVGRVSRGVHGTRTRIERYLRCETVEPGEVVDSPATDRECALLGVAMVSATEGWAVGGSGPGGGQDFTSTLIAYWDGGGWSRTPSPDPGTTSNQLSAVAARAADDVWAVGHSRSKESGGRPEGLVLHWDGDTWNQIPVPPSAMGGDQLQGVAIAGPDSVWVAGTSLPGPDADDQSEAAFALHWNGSDWQMLRSQGTTEFTGVSARSENDVWFAGYAELPGEPDTAHIEHWDGYRLSAATPIVTVQDNVASALNAISAGSRQVVAVGWQAARTPPVRQPQVFLAASPRDSS